MSSTPEIIYKLISSDGKLFQMPESSLNQSITLKQCAAALSSQEIEKSDPIPVLNVNGAIFEKVLTWCEYHKEEYHKEEEDDKWESEYLQKLDNQELFDLICAANYLDVKTLLNATCKTVANMIKGKSPEEMRQIFEIPTDEEDEKKEEEEKEKTDK